MKKLALIFVCGVAGMTLNAQEYTIQVISAIKESSITPAFEKKVKKTGIPYIKKEEGERHVLLVGSYETRDRSGMDAKKVKKSVVHDAFVRPMERKEVSGAISKEEHSSTHKAIKESIAADHVSPLGTASVVVNHNEPAVAISSAAPNHDTNATGEMKEAKGCSASNIVVIYDRNAIRKYDISEAIEYYKNSSYYTFKSTAGR
ncbi:MAG: hypothetical protein M0P91_02085 [Sulfuricurvum sp.]|jgi:hypothetical protein|uniref:hypothetical protein n=1 Tax=Sulfuricurvum sp. TaxID=2025608 RepID=UPI0025D5A910|nr:hypothetical protein [Sulfuricurvum sp.]MCK9371959.1 hypothetical protein [Sulfuricurvum sp.]